MAVRFHSLLAFAVLPAAVLASCVSTTPKVDRAHGVAVTAAVHRQTIDANAGARGVLSFDGPSADAAVKHYFQSFASPPAAADTLAIGVSRGGTGSHP